MTRGRLRFGVMLVALELSERGAAERMGVSQALVHYWKTGQRVPGRSNSGKIRDLSAEWAEGPIEPSEWDEVVAEEPRTGTEG